MDEKWKYLRPLSIVTNIVHAFIPARYVNLGERECTADWETARDMFVACFKAP